jgi:ribosomal protein S18 acetylase RimI-like enzyme
MPGKVVLRRLGEADASEVVAVVCDAFADYPVMRFVLGDDREQYPARLRRFAHFIVMARVYRQEFIVGIAEGDALQGAALVSIPARAVTSAPLDALREELWRELGADARARYDAYGAAFARFVPPDHHLHLNVLAVRHAAHGKGYARKLLEHVHALSREDPASNGVSLTTENEANVSLYEHFGYRVVGQVEISPGLMCWGFFRPDA